MTIDCGCSMSLQTIKYRPWFKSKLTDYQSKMMLELNEKEQTSTKRENQWEPQFRVEKNLENILADELRTENQSLRRMNTELQTSIYFRSFASRIFHIFIFCQYSLRQKCLWAAVKRDSEVNEKVTSKQAEIQVLLRFYQLNLQNELWRSTQIDKCDVNQLKQSANQRFFICFFKR